MPSKRPLHNEDNNQNQSKKAKMVKAIQECIKGKPVVKLLDLFDKSTTLIQALGSQIVTSVQGLLKINTPLHVAAKLGNLTIVEDLLQNRADVNARKYNCGETPLHTAVSYDQIDVVEKLLRYGANVDFKTWCSKRTPLHLAIQRKNLRMVQKLLEHGANVDSFDKDDSTPLHICVSEGNVEIAKVLLKYGAKDDLLDDKGQTALYLAIYMENFQIAEFLAKNGAKYYGKEEGDHIDARVAKFLLLNATEEGYFEVSKILVENGANVDGIVGEVSNLHYAAESGFLDILELLIKSGANVNFLDEDRQTPFHGAAIQNRADVVKTFFELGTNLDLNIRNIEGNTVFEEVVEKKLGGIFKMLIYDNHKKN